MRANRGFVLAVSLGAAVLAAGNTPAFAKHKGKKAKAGGEELRVPVASPAEVDKLRAVQFGDPKSGTFHWGMKPEEVMASVKGAIEAKYQPRIEQAKADPGKQQRVRDEMNREINTVKKSYTKFDGQTSGWDVSIVGPEFQQNTSEAVLVTKEDIWTRYFFFFENGLYKMYLAFNKDALGGKSFQDFGKSMQAKYGAAREVFHDEKVKGGIDHKLDHYIWTAGGDRLKLVDRSEFYGVYCLVLYDKSSQDRVNERRKVVNPGEVEKDALVEAVTSKSDNGRDSNDDIIDRLTGKQIKKPGEEDSHGNIVVPSPSGSAASATTDTDINHAADVTPSSSAKDSGGKKKSKKGGTESVTDGLEL